MNLLEYIKGLRKGKEANRLEKESMKDPFLADAIDGYNQVDGKHSNQIDELRNRIYKKSSARNYRHPIAWSIAASLILGVCISSYFLYLKNATDTTFPEQAHIIKEQSNDSIQSITEQTESKGTSIAQMGKTSAPKLSSDTIAIEATVQENSESANTADNIIKVFPTAETVYTDKIALVKDTQVIDQSHYITGQVTDKNKEPIIGASVQIKGTNIGTLSDINGNFSLRADSNQELSVQFIGYTPITLPIDTNKNMLIAMNENNDMLNEVVVVGYGTQKRANLTGAVATVSPQVKPSIPQPVMGKKEYRKYLKKNLIHPIDSVCRDTKGEVTLLIMVNEQGRPYQVNILKSLCQSADKEAVRLVKEGPDWTYGTLPVKIKIEF